MSDNTAPSTEISVRDALDMYEEYKSYWSDIYKEAAIDLKMAIGDKPTHWGEDNYNNRIANGKICPVINELPQFIHQVTNDIRQNVPSIKVLPVADADIETAEICRGLFRAIEDHSHADEICDTAAEYAVKCSIGFMRVDHDYIDDDSDEQEVLFKTVPDPLSVWLDPSSVEYDGRDANGAIFLEPISRKDFEKSYPGKKFSSFTDIKIQGNSDNIIIAEIFIREMSGNRGKKAIIHRYKFSGDEMLAKTIFPGKYIPLVPIYGEVTWVDGKRNIASLIRQARDPQLRVNHWATKESEILSMAPIAPVMAARGTLVNDRGQWQSPGSEMVLEYELQDIDGNSAPPPQRLAPPPIPTGIINAMQGAKEDIKESMGLYNASIGQKSNEVSGVAIDARKIEGDVATFHFPDNVRRSYGHMGEIAIEMFPIIYDTPRIIQTLNDESDIQMIGINGAPLQQGQNRSYDLTKGKYRVRITTGASYTTKRQEEANFLSQIAQKDPNFMQIGGDLLFKSMDTPGSQALAARYKKLINPQLLDDNPQAPDPQKIQMQQALQQAQLEIQQLASALQSKQSEEQLKQGELSIKQQELQIKEQELQLKAMQAQKPEGNLLEADKQAFDQSIKERELALKEAEFKLKLMQAEHQMINSSDNIEEKPIGIKLDTSGFQMMKTPEQEAIEAEQYQEQFAEKERQKQEDALKFQQSQAMLQTLSSIASQLTQLTDQIAQPKQVIRDKETGAIIGVQ